MISATAVTPDADSRGDRDPARDPDLATWLARVAEHRARRARGRTRMRRAAVAAILSAGLATESPRLLLIRRAARDGDPWAGHMALPGGRVEPGDADDAATAERETSEEIGVDLAGHQVGRLSDLMAKAHSGPAPMVVSPWIYLCPPGATPGTSAEVDEVVTIPLSFFADPANRHERTWRLGRVPLAVPCYDWEGHVVWGLTLAMIDELVAVGYGRRLPSTWTRLRGLARSVRAGRRPRPSR